MIKTRLVSRLKPRATHVAPTVQALLEAIVHDEFGTGQFYNEDILEYTVGVMRDRIDLMPGYLSVGMVMLTAMFERSTIASTGRPFHKLPLAQRVAAFNGWKSARLGLMRDFTDFYTKMGIFVYCARLEEESGDTYQVVKPRGRVRGVA